jgi:cob(I)alamin adenosyltransferase
MSITTKRGDGGETSLPGGRRVSKSDLRVECYGTIDELISQLGFARSLCTDADMAVLIKTIQQDLFKIAAAAGTPADAPEPAPKIATQMVDELGQHAHRIENTPGILGDWSIPGDVADAAAVDVARTVCRRSERLVVQLAESGELTDSNVVAYLNRLSDLLWLIGRWIEAKAGADTSLRPKDQPGKPWSRAW